MIWLTSKRQFSLNRTLVMGILNVTPDSLSDGGNFLKTDLALKRAEKMISEGADILDVGGESTRPNSQRVSAQEEIDRVVPIIERISNNFDVPISIDTSKSEVAEAAVNAGAEIINDISGLRFDENLGVVAAKYKTGLILMHLRGTFETMHKQESVQNILEEVKRGFIESISVAKNLGVIKERIALDIGIGFSKTFEQNLELIANLKILQNAFPDFPILVGTSRKSFIGKILNELDAGKRLAGSLSSIAVSVWNGAKIVRVHDVRETVQALKVVEAIKEFRG